LTTLFRLLRWKVSPGGLHSQAHHQQQATLTDQQMVSSTITAAVLMQTQIFSIYNAVRSTQINAKHLNMSGWDAGRPPLAGGAAPAVRA
jgi:hypothetical protein